MIKTIWKQFTIASKQILIKRGLLCIRWDIFNPVAENEKTRDTSFDDKYLQGEGKL